MYLVLDCDTGVAGARHLVGVRARCRRCQRLGAGQRRLRDIRARNAKAVKDTDGGGSVAIVAGGAVVLIGGGHPRRPADYVRRQTDIEEGLLTVTKGGAFSKGASSRRYAASPPLTD